MAELNEVQGTAFYPATLIENCVVNVICSLLFGKGLPYTSDEFKVNFVEHMKLLYWNIPWYR